MSIKFYENPIYQQCGYMLIKFDNIKIQNTRSKDSFSGNLRIKLISSDDLINEGQIFISYDVIAVAQLSPVQRNCITYKSEQKCPKLLQFTRQFTIFILEQQVNNNQYAIIDHYIHLNLETTENKKIENNGGRQRDKSIQFKKIKEIFQIRISMDRISVRSKIEISQIYKIKNQRPNSSYKLVDSRKFRLHGGIVKEGALRRSTMKSKIDLIEIELEAQKKSHETTLRTMKIEAENMLRRKREDMEILMRQKISIIENEAQKLRKEAININTQYKELNELKMQKQRLENKLFQKLKQQQMLKECKILLDEKNQWNNYNQKIKPFRQIIQPKQLKYRANAQIKSNNDEDKCIICYERKRDCANKNCGHLSCCLDCGKRLEKCPMCRKDMQAMKIYL